MSFFQKRRWLVEFGVVCLIPIVLLGMFLMQTLQSNVKGRALSNASEQARLVADVGLASPLAGIDDPPRRRRGPQQAALDRQLDTVREGNNVQRVILRNREGRTVYADDRSLVGQVAPPDGTRSALVGKIASSVGSSPQGKVFQVFVPVRLGAGPAVGSVELWLPYAPIAASIERQNGKIQIMLIAGLLLLWGTLLTVVSMASQRLRRQAAEKEEQALSDGLTGLPNRTM